MTECWVVNARHFHNVPGRKTDVKDAQWLAELAQHGLVRSSFVPPKEILSHIDYLDESIAGLSEAIGEAVALSWRGWSCSRRSGSR